MLIKNGQSRTPVPTELNENESFYVALRRGISQRFYPYLVGTGVLDCPFHSIKSKQIGYI